MKIIALTVFAVIISLKGYDLLADSASNSQVAKSMITHHQQLASIAE